VGEHVTWSRSQWRIGVVCPELLPSRATSVRAGDFQAADQVISLLSDTGGSVAVQVSPGTGIVTFDFDGRTIDGTRVMGRLVSPAWS